MLNRTKKPESTKTPKTRTNKGGNRNLTLIFAARLLAKRIAVTDAHARRLLEASFGELNAGGWYAVSSTIECGVTDVDLFEQTCRDYEVL